MELGKLIAVFDADTKKFDAGLRGVQTKIGLVTKDLGKATGSTHQLTGATGTASGSLAGMGGALGIAAGAAIGAAAAISAAAAGIYKLATFSQQLGAEIFDLSQKINFSAETLSSLKIAAELSGGSLASLSTALGIFDRNMAEATDASTEMSRIFKVLNIDTMDNEKALRQAFTALGNMTSGSLQTATAMKIFGRSGKEVLGVIKETGGSVDDFIRRMEDLGLTITTSGSKKADKFGDDIRLLQLKLEAIARQIGQELVPTVSKAADDISKWLKENQGEIIKTAKELGSLISQVYAFGKAVASPFIMQVIITRKIIDVTGLGSGPRAPGEASGPESGTLDLGSMNAPGSLPQGLGNLSVFRTPGRGALESPFRLSPAQQQAASARKAQEDLEKQLRSATGKQGGGGGGGGKSRIDDAIRDQKRLDDLILSSIKNRLESEEGEVSRSYDRRSIIFQEYFTESIRLETERYDAVKANLQREEAAAKRVVDSGKGGLKAKIELQTAVNALEEEEFRHGERLAEIAKEQKQHQDEILESLEKQVFAASKLVEFNEQMMAAMEFGPVATAVGDLEEFMKLEPPDISAQTQAILDMRERMRDLGFELTDIFHESVGAGFDQGVKRGLATLGQGLLDIVQNVFLKRLAEGLGNILADFATPSSGGGGSWLQKLLGIGIGAVAGGIGAGGSSGFSGGPVDIKSFVFGAKGGFVPGGDSVPAMLTPGELVLNKKQQGMMGQPVINNYTINLPPSPKGGYTSPKSQRELGDKLLAMLQGSQA
jgi:hypothetical protein